MSPNTAAAKAALDSYKPVASTSAMEGANEKYGVGESETRLSKIKGLVGNLESSIEAVDPSVTGRTSGTFTTEGQRSALVSRERQPLLGSLAKQQGAYSDEQDTLTRKQTLAGQMASALLNDDRSTYQRLLDTYNRSSAEDASAEEKRRFETQQNEQKRQFEVGVAERRREAAAAAAAKSSAVSKASTPSVSQFLVQAFSGYDPKKMKMFTEREVIPALMANYNLTKQQAENYAYKYRKDVFKE